ncbi:MAG: hypothetical protein JWP69_325 [Flaviaesturariibacter sp.]|nr:hypothetical protein [Flaviaesturariibacter sp.]
MTRQQIEKGAVILLFLTAVLLFHLSRESAKAKEKIYYEKNKPR